MSPKSSGDLVPSMAMTVLKLPGVRQVRRVGVIAAVLAAGLYFVPVLTLIYLGCCVLGVSRHRKITAELLQKYFMGNGIGTWLLAPLNLLADLLSHRNKGIFRLEDLPEAHRREVEACVRAFVENGARIKAHIATPLAAN